VRHLERGLLFTRHEPWLRIARARGDDVAIDPEREVGVDVPPDVIEVRLIHRRDERDGSVHLAVDDDWLRRDHAVALAVGKRDRNQTIEAPAGEQLREHRARFGPE